MEVDHFSFCGAKVWLSIVFTENDIVSCKIPSKCIVS